MSIYVSIYIFLRKSRQNIIILQPFLKFHIIIPLPSLKHHLISYIYDTL